MPEKRNQKLIKQVVFDSSKENWLHLRGWNDLEEGDGPNGTVGCCGAPWSHALTQEAKPGQPTYVSTKQPWWSQTARRIMEGNNFLFL